MNWNDYEAVWRRQQPPVGASADVEVLKQTFDVKSRKLAGGLLVRDIAEASAGIFVSIVFIAVARHQKIIAWPIYVAVALVLGVTGFFIAERLRSHRKKLSPAASMRAKLEADMAELRRQRWLLLNLWKWYLGPLAAAIVIIGLTLRANRPSWDLSRSPIFLGSYFGFVALLLWFAWFINRRAVRQQIEPRIEELEKLRDNLLSTFPTPSDLP